MTDAGQVVIKHRTSDEAACRVCHDQVDHNDLNQGRPLCRRCQALSPRVAISLEHQRPGKGEERPGWACQGSVSSAWHDAGYA